MLKGTRDGILRKVQPVSIHGQVSWDVFFTDVDDPDGQVHNARIGPEAVIGTNLEPGDRIRIQPDSAASVSGEGVASERLYTTPEDLMLVAAALGTGERGRYLLAATFGNVHGLYAPRHVKLRPEILNDGQVALARAHPGARCLIKRIKKSET